MEYRILLHDVKSLTSCINTVAPIPTNGDRTLSNKEEVLLCNVRDFDKLENDRSRSNQAWWYTVRAGPTNVQKKRTVPLQLLFPFLDHGCPLSPLFSAALRRPRLFSFFYSQLVQSSGLTHNCFVTLTCRFVVIFSSRHV